MIAGLQLAENGGGDGGHAGSRGAGIFSAFERAYAPFEHVVGGAAVSGIDKSVRLALEARLCCLGRIVDEALREIDCL